MNSKLITNKSTFEDFSIVRNYEEKNRANWWWRTMLMIWFAVFMQHFVLFIK